MAEVRVISSAGGHGVIFRDGDGYRSLGTRRYCWIDNGVWDVYRIQEIDIGPAEERARRFVRGSDWRVVEASEHE